MRLFYLNSLVVSLQTLGDRRRREGREAAVGLQEGEGRGLFDLPPVELDLGHLRRDPGRDVRNGVRDQELQHQHQVLEWGQKQHVKLFIWGCSVAQRKIFRFPPSSPVFQSCLCRDFFSLLLSW